MDFYDEILQNDNVFIWLGYFDNTKVNNVLILYGGEVLILKAIRRFDLNTMKTRDDILNMSVEEFIDNYDLNDYFSIFIDFAQDLKKNKESYENDIKKIINHVKDGVKNKLYPPHMSKIQKPGGFIDKYMKIVEYYINKIDSSNNIREIIKFCEKKLK